MGKAHVGGSLVEKEASSGTAPLSFSAVDPLGTHDSPCPFGPPTNFRMDDREEVMAAKLIDRRFHNVPGMYLVICTVEIHEEPKPLLTEV